MAQSEGELFAPNYVVRAHQVVKREQIRTRDGRLVDVDPGSWIVRYEPPIDSHGGGAWWMTDSEFQDRYVSFPADAIADDDFGPYEGMTPDAEGEPPPAE